MVRPKPFFFLFAAAIAMLHCHAGEGEWAGEVRPELPGLELEPTGVWSGDYSTDSLRIIELYSLYDYYEDRRLFDSAVQVCREMIQLGGPLLEFRYDSSLYEKYAKAFGGIAWDYVMMGRFDESLIYANYSLEKIKERFGENHIRATEDLVVIAYNYLYRGDYDRAVEYIHKSLHVMNQIFEKNHRYFGNNYENLGYIYKEKGDYEKAVHYFQKVLENRKAVGRYGGSWTYPVFMLVECYLALDDPNAATGALKEGFEVLAAQPGYERNVYTLYLAEAKIHFHKGQYQAAHTSAEKFINDFTQNKVELGYTPVLGDGLFLLAQIEDAMGRPEKALAAFQQAIQAWDQSLGFGASTQIDALLGMARLHKDQGDYAAALQTIQLALERTIPGFESSDLLALPTLTGMTANEPLLDILTEKIAILWKGYQARKEEKYLEAAWETSKGIINYMQECREGYQGQDSKITLSQKAIPLVETAMACADAWWAKTADPRYLEEAFLCMEKVKSIVLLENLHTSFARASSNLSRELLDKATALNRELALYNRLILEEQQKEARQDTVKLYYWFDKRLALKEASDSLAGVIKAKHPEYFQLKENLPISRIQDVQKQLRGGEVVVEYFLGDSTLTVFTITTDQSFFHRIPWTTNEAALLDEFTQFVMEPLREWSTQDIQPWVKNGQKLFGLLFPDWEEISTPRSLVVIPDGKLDYLPFHLLPTGEVANMQFKELPYLLKSCPVRYQFSSSLLIQPYKCLKEATVDYAGFAPVYQGTELIASRNKEDSSRMAVLYPEIVRDGLSKLKYNQPEVAEAASIWKSAGYAGIEATEHRFKDIGPNARILHLAMHALTNDREPLLSQLIFSGDNSGEEDGKLHNYELQNLQLSADLTVLSACNTGAGQLRRGEGVMSVSRAFRLAGCPNIVMSLWQANDRSTQEVVNHFFQNLKDGKGKSEALQKSSLLFLRSTKERYTHPFYWGNMMLIGDDEPVEFSLLQFFRQLNRRFFK